MNGSGTCTTNNACRGDSCSDHTMNATLNLNIVIVIVMKFLIFFRMWGGGVDDKKKFRTWVEGKKKIRKGAWVGLVKKK